MKGSRGERCRELVDQVVRAGSTSGLAASGVAADSAAGEAIGRVFSPVWGAAGAEITEVRVNGPRIDARIMSPDGRAWLAVLWTDGDESIRVRHVDLYERPAAYERSPGLVVVLNGPSSVGKSTLMATFADSAPVPWACLDEPLFGRVPTRFLAWPETTGPIVDGVLAALAAAASAGNRYIVSAGGIGQDRFRVALRGVDTVYVGLDAPLAVLLQRQVTQRDKFGGLAEESVGIHEGWEYDLWIDTSGTQPQEAARRLAALLDARR